VRPSRPIADLMRDAESILRLCEQRGWTTRDTQRVGLLAEVRRRRPDIHEIDASTQEVLWGASMNWRLGGFPRVVVGHKHAALLMCTSVPLDVVQIVPLPWLAFLIDVPAGLVEVPDRGAGEPPGRVDHVLVWRSGTDGATCIGLNGVFGAVETAFELTRVLLPESKADRAAKALARYVLGVCIEMDQHRPSPPRAVTGPVPIKRDARGEPVTTTFALRRDVTIDCRDAVRDYCRGTGTKLAMRSVVRGHWKYQPHGAGRADRKFIHIEPYWRGPDDAPIALRSHVLGTSQASP
jgi:hypothetical protein